MPEETNVRVPQAALDSLARVAAARGLSRDQTMRQLLVEHVERQEALKPASRLTHAATIMRYPPPAGRNQPKNGKQLRLRLPEGMTDRARAVSLHLPGQSTHRGHRDYAARPLTDAVMTAIAYEEPIADPMLDGIPMLRHRAAHGLWRLAVEATLTGSEKDLQKQAEAEATERSLCEVREGTAGSAGRAERVLEILERDVAWHAHHRTAAVHALVDARLRGTDACRFERLLYDQEYVDSVAAEKWYDLLAEIRDAYSWTKFKGAHNVEGRGGAAVWRAERELELDGMARWLRESGGGAARTRVVDPPSWRLSIPEGWQPITFPATASLPTNWAAHVADGRVLHIKDGGQQLLWPTVVGDDSTPGPVPGIAMVIAAAGKHSTLDIIETLLLQLAPEARREPEEDNYELDAEELDDFQLVPQVWVPAYTAHKLGLIDENQRRQLVADAELSTQSNMDKIIAAVDDDETREELIDVTASPALFRKLVSEIDPDLLAYDEVLVENAEWVWSVTSLAAEIAAGTVNVDSRKWLAKRLLVQHKRALERSMEDAARRAFDRFQIPYEDFFDHL